MTGLRALRWLRAGALVAGLSASALVTPAPASATTPGVLLVGSFHGVKGQYSSIQAAVDAARPGDWILIGPGDYHERHDLTSPPAAAVYRDGDYGGVLISTRDLHLRGMSRSKVVVDGTLPGAPTPCSADPAWQSFGPTATAGAPPEGRNGIVVWKADGVSIQNLTVCNFLGGSGSSGNEIWWNGGSDRIGLHGYSGSYLSATSTFFGPDGTLATAEQTAARYGIFSEAASGGTWNQIYASNFNDSGAYVGGCQQVCNVTIDHAWMQYSALGYSGTNSGGAVVVEHSQFDHNKDGFDTNTQFDADPPAPQNGNCPGHKISPITHTRSCWVFMDNYVHDNNNPNVPEAGSASNGPTGTGMTVSGGTNDTVMDNRFVNNGAWGVLFVPYPDENPPILGQTCSKTGGVQFPGFGCVFDPKGDALIHNTFRHDGFFANPSNADFGELTLSKGEPQNCFRANSAPKGSVPADLEKVQDRCGPLTKAANTDPTLLAQVLCDTGFGSCPAGSSYPAFTGVVMHRLPKLASMPNPCVGVPANRWCRSGRPR